MLASGRLRKGLSIHLPLFRLAYVHMGVAFGMDATSTAREPPARRRAQQQLGADWEAFEWEDEVDEPISIRAEQRLEQRPARRQQALQRMHVRLRHALHASHISMMPGLQMRMAAESRRMHACMHALRAGSSHSRLSERVHRAAVQAAAAAALKAVASEMQMVQPFAKMLPVCKNAGSMVTWGVAA